MSEQEALQKQLELAYLQLSTIGQKLRSKSRVRADLLDKYRETLLLTAGLEKRLYLEYPKPPPVPVLFTSYPTKSLPVLPSYISVGTEQARLMLELNDLDTSHHRRLEIGDRLDEIGDTRPGVGVRDDGLPDIAWLPVATGGEITIESETFSIQPFYIAKYLITYAQYEAFVKAKDGYNNPEWWRGMPKEYQRQKLAEQSTKSKNNPRDRVSWYQSVAFARWLNAHMKGWQAPNPEGLGPTWIIGENAQVRLPLEWEWQWAYQGGSKQRHFPWGVRQEGYANVGDVELERAIAVGMYPQGAADCGALDMSGNVWEWCANDYTQIKAVDLQNGERKAIRGDSFYNYRDSKYEGNRPGSDPNIAISLHGLRLVVSTQIEGF